MINALHIKFDADIELGKNIFDKKHRRLVFATISELIILELNFA